MGRPNNTNANIEREHTKPTPTYREDVNNGQQNTMKNWQKKLTVACSVGDFIDVSWFTAVVDASSGGAGVRAGQTVLRTFCIIRHNTTCNSSSSNILPSTSHHHWHDKIAN